MRFKEALARVLAPTVFDEYDQKLKDKEIEVNQRVARIVADMDPFEPFLKRFGGVFTEEFDHPEDNMSEAKKIGFYQWAYTQEGSEYMEFILKFLINNQANATLKRRNVSNEETLYCRAKITTGIQFRDEIRRLANLYREYLDKQKEDDQTELMSTTVDV